jgi:predicted ATPase/DNA-binding SARP family transcriptional activator
LKLSKMLEVRLLGKFDVRRGGKSIALPSRPTQSLFAYLILSAGTAHRREKLAGLLWPDSLEETARDNLRHALWRVRKALQSASSARFLRADDLTIGFEPSSEYWFDAAALERLDEKASADELITVLSEYQGELLPGFYDEWVVLEREHLNSIFEHKMARLMSLLQGEKRWLDILDWGERWIKLGQKPEPAYRALMYAHAAKGDMSKVATTFERCVKSLKEIGVEPSDQTKELYGRLKAGIEPIETGPVAPIKETRKDFPKTNLPVPLTSFFGRDKEVDQVLKLMRQNRLVTLTGSGGVGKTRLAIQSSNKMLPRFKDGVWWVTLVGLNDPWLVPQAIAKVMEVRETSNEPIIETLKTDLKSKELLIVLDNCEHLIEASARYAELLLSACPKLKILATSREQLGIFSETTWHVPPLPLPIGKFLPLKELRAFASVGLFLERAKNVNPDFALTEENVLYAAQICTRLDGIPLAIELAAARVKMISLEEMLLRLDDRFSLLTAGSRTALPHQQTLRATIDWSYELLTEPERVLFRRLAVFASGFKLKSVEEVCGFGNLKGENLFELLARLVDKSLVITDLLSNGQARYRFLETIREYALEKLKSFGEADITRDRHLEFFMSLAEEAELNHFSPEQLEWFKRVEAEIDNMRAAMDWSTAATLTEDPKTTAWRQQTGLRAVGALVWFWHRSYAREISERLRHMLVLTDGQTLERAKALYSLGFLYWTVNNFSDARSSLEEALTLSSKFDDRITLARSLGYLGAVAAAEGDYALTRSLLEESLSVGRELGPAGRKPVSWALTILGDVHFEQGDYGLAKTLYEEAVALTREAHEKNLLGLMIRRLGYVALRAPDHVGASDYFAESLKLNQEVQHPVGICAALTAYANLALAQGKASAAAQLFGAVENYLNTSSMQLFYSDKIEYQLGVAHLWEQLEDAVLEKAWKKGALIPIEEAIEFALKEARP